jgi:Flp pilus assembly protein TadG
MVHLLQKLPASIRSDRGSQIVEFAVALPLLIVFVVGIFDFGEAFNQKQKLSNVVAKARASPPHCRRMI